MSLEIDGYEQTLLFAKAILCGACLGVFYDFFRFLRVMKKFGKYSIMIQDILFWIVSAVIVFAFMMIYSWGLVRIYLVIGIFFGEFCYYFSIGKITFCFFELIKRFLNMSTSFLYRYIIKPVLNFLVKRLFLPVKQSFLPLFSKINNLFKNFRIEKRKSTCK